MRKPRWTWLDDGRRALPETVRYDTHGQGRVEIVPVAPAVRYATATYRLVWRGLNHPHPEIPLATAVGFAVALKAAEWHYFNLLGLLAREAVNRASAAREAKRAARRRPATVRCRLTGTRTCGRDNAGWTECQVAGVCLRQPEPVQ